MFAARPAMKIFAFNLNEKNAVIKERTVDDITAAARPRKIFPVIFVTAIAQKAPVRI